jgi:hypothetical protein
VKNPGLAPGKKMPVSSADIQQFFSAPYFQKVEDGAKMPFLFDSTQIARVERDIFANLESSEVSGFGNT